MISTPDAHFVGSEQLSDFTESCSNVARVVHRTLAECTHFFFSASGMPKFRKFCNSFAKFLRKFCVISTPGAHFFGSKQACDFTESYRDVARFSQRTLAECTDLFRERHAEIPEILQSFRELLAQILCDLDARRALFRI